MGKEGRKVNRVAEEGLLELIACCAGRSGGGERCTHVMHGRSLMTVDRRPSHPYNMRQIFTDQADIACTKRAEAGVNRVGKKREEEKLVRETSTKEQEDRTTDTSMNHHGPSGSLPWRRRRCWHGMGKTRGRIRREVELHFFFWGSALLLIVIVEPRRAS